jgi:hypothetical protein
MLTATEREESLKKGKGRQHPPFVFWVDIQKEIPFMTWTVKTGSLLIAQIHSYLLGLKSIKTLIVCLQTI